MLAGTWEGPRSILSLNRRIGTSHVSYPLAAMPLGESGHRQCANHMLVARNATIPSIIAMTLTAVARRSDRRPRDVNGVFGRSPEGTRHVRTFKATRNEGDARPLRRWTSGDAPARNGRLGSGKFMALSERDGRKCHSSTVTPPYHHSSLTPTGHSTPPKNQSRRVSGYSPPMQVACAAGSGF